MLRPMAQDTDDLCSSIDLSQVVDLGDGPTAILFLHGLFGTPDHWRGVMEKLADRYRVIAPQLPIDPQPGRRSNGMKTIGDLSAAVTDLVQELGIAPLVICGNSLGGLVAIDMPASLTRKTQCKTTRNENSQAYFVPGSSREYHWMSFFPRTARDWNTIPDTAVTMESPESFRNSLLSS